MVLMTHGWVGYNVQNKVIMQIVMTSSNARSYGRKLYSTETKHCSLSYFLLLVLYNSNI